MIDIIDMIDDLNEVEQDVLEEIDPDLVSYTFSTRGGDQLIYQNKVYQIKKKLTTAAGLFRIQWRCKDREHCRTTVRLLSLRENLLVQPWAQTGWACGVTTSEADDDGSYS